MDETQARGILEAEVLQPEGGLYSLGWYLKWDRGDVRADLDGRFTADELEAIAWWMRHHCQTTAKET